MDVYAIKEDTLNELADAIRSKTSITNQMTPAEMAEAVRSIIAHTNEDIDGMIMRTSEVIESASASNVASYAFFNNPSVRVVVLPNAYVIGERAFCNCPNLEHVSSGARQIDGYAFYNCSELLEVIFDHDLNSIGVAAFDGCSSLKEINLRSTMVRTIAASAFANSGIEELWLPEDGFCALASVNAFSGTALAEGGAGGVIHVPMQYRVSYEANRVWGSVFRNSHNRVVTY
jgi:hypothetical protein